MICKIKKHRPQSQCFLFSSPGFHNSKMFTALELSQGRTSLLLRRWAETISPPPDDVRQGIPIVHLVRVEDVPNRFGRPGVDLPVRILLPVRLLAGAPVHEPSPVSGLGSVERFGHMWPFLCSPEIGGRDI